MPNVSDYDAIELSSWNRGPLTTVFTPPSSCLSQLTLTVDENYITTIFQGHDGWGDAACYPPTRTGTPNWEGWGAYYYSPGICPEGYVTACTQTTSQAGLNFSLPTSTHAAICCPSGYACAGTGHQCQTEISYNQILTGVWSVPDDIDYYTLDDGYSTTYHSLQNLTMDFATTGVADGIPVFWRDVDVSLFPATTTTAATGTTPAPTTGITRTSTASPKSTVSSTPPTGLSTGGKVAIATVIPVVAVAALLWIFFWIRRRKQRLPHREHSALNASEMDGSGWGVTGIASKECYLAAVEADPDNALTLELDSGNAVTLELDSRGPYGNQGLPQELPLTAAHSTNSRTTSPYRPRGALTYTQSGETSASDPLLGTLSQKSPHQSESSETGPTSTTQTTMVEKEAKLARLRADIERVRAEKEQLKSLNDLESMEEELKQEILKQQRETMGL
ncbi:MAG: hypothetical protein M1818_001567 [Claussenomyces sp. TS43310]|nr:MAG: hypothetical protein M1818_001567 [Claussenomyces sp. TS43310]